MNSSSKTGLHQDEFALCGNFAVNLCNAFSWFLNKDLRVQNNDVTDIYCVRYIMNGIA